MASQRQYLDGFAGAVLEGSLSDAEITARGALYGGLVWAAYQMGRSHGALQAGLTTATWFTEGDQNVCDDCQGYADGSPYPIAEIPTFPGMGDSACLTNCRCWLEFA